MTVPDTQPVIYEVECTLDPADAADFDAWLPGHVRQMLACPGFTGVEIQAPALEAKSAPVRRIQYRLESAAALERYLAEDAAGMQADVVARFGDQVACTRRVLVPHAAGLPLPEAPVTCRNCGAAVPGKFCAECGQSGEVHVLSVGDVAHDIVHSVLHVDSRVWRTLHSLLLRPGELSSAFIAGQRQRYLPPFRLYLVISVAFFALTAMLPQSSQAPLFQIDKSGETVVAPVTLRLPKDSDAPPAPSDTTSTRRKLEQVAADPRAPRVARELAAEVERGMAAGEIPDGVSINLGWPRLDRLLEEAAGKIRQDGGRRLAQLFFATVPKLMFLFLPLMAAVAQFFYWKPRRLYAEHLVLFLHVHAFVFLLLSVTTLIGAAASLELPWIGLLDFVGLVLKFYIPYYAYRAMRVVYGNGRVLTAAKFVAVSAVYFLLLGITMAVGVVYSMLSL